MFFVYRLLSTEFPEQQYTGFTIHIEKRLLVHNAGQVPHTSKYKPWKIINFFTFQEKEKDLAFEKYLKTGSGRTFAKKHF